MIKAIIFDFSRVILKVKDLDFNGSLNDLHDDLSQFEGYRMFEHFELNKELLDLIGQLRVFYKTYIFTTGHIHNLPEIQEKISDLFIKMFTLEEIGGQKDDPETFKRLAGLINLKPEEILFVDDTLANIQAAHRAGMMTIQYRDNKQFFEEVEKLNL